MEKDKLDKIDYRYCNFSDQLPIAK